MGNSIAAEKGTKDNPPLLSPEQPAVTVLKSNKDSQVQNEQKSSPESHQLEKENERGPGTFEEIHRKCKGCKDMTRVL